MKKGKFEIERKIRERACYRCNGVGHTLENKRISGNLTQFDVIPCPTCNGTGIYIDTYYILIAGNFAIGMDTIK